MSTTSRRRRAQHEQPSRSTRRSYHLPGLAILGVAALLALGAFFFQGLFTGSGAQSLPVATNNIKGSLTAPVEIEDWSDFQCSACKLFADSIGRMLEQGPVAQGQVRVVFHHKSFLGVESTSAAAASECAAEQGQFWPYHDRLFAEQRGRDAGAFSRANLKRFGAELGLDTASFNACVDNDLALARIKAENQLAEKRGVTKTPTLIVNGKKIEGVPSWELMRQTIEQALVLAPTVNGRGL